MKTTKCVTQNELQQVFEIIDDKLWRKSYKDSRGHVFPPKMLNVVVNTREGYYTVRFKNKILKYHRVLWILTHGNIPVGYEIDHINGNRIDNRLENLRLVTRRQNQQNQAMHRNGRLYGTTYIQHIKKWASRVKINGVTHYIGYYDTEYEAHYAYKNFLLERGVA